MFLGKNGLSLLSKGLSSGDKISYIKKVSGLQCKLICVNTFLASGLVHPCHLDESISSFWGFMVDPFIFTVLFIDISVSKQYTP